MFCPACGTAADADDRFCQHCGKPLPTGGAQPDAQPTAPGTSPEFPPYVEPPPPPGPGSGWGPPPASPYQWGKPYPPPGPTVPSASGAPPVYRAYPGQAPPWPGYGPSVPLAPFGAPLAGWWQRVGSVLIDSVVLGVPLGIVDTILNVALGTRHLVLAANGASISIRSLEGGGRAVLWIVDIVVPLLYFAILNGTHNGQTAGNHAPHIAVRDVDTGRAIGFSRGVVRFVVRVALYAAFLLPGLLNDLFPLWDRRHQTIADKAARSVVIRLG